MYHSAISCWRCFSCVCHMRSLHNAFIRRLSCFNTPSRYKAAQHCDERICFSLSFCLSASISKTRWPNFTTISMRVFCAVARSSSCGVATRYCTSGFVDVSHNGPIADRHTRVRLSAWSYRFPTYRVQEQSVMSTIVLFSCCQHGLNSRASLGSWWLLVQT